MGRTPIFYNHPIYRIPSYRNRTYISHNRTYHLFYRNLIFHIQVCLLNQDWVLSCDQRTYDENRVGRPDFHRKSFDHKRGPSPDSRGKPECGKSDCGKKDGKSCCGKCKSGCDKKESCKSGDCKKSESCPKKDSSCKKGEKSCPDKKEDCPKKKRKK